MTTYQNRKFISVHRCANTLYWICPKRGCDQPHTMIENDGTPKTYHCVCGCSFIVEQVTQVTQFTARLLIEIKGVTNEIECK